MHLPAQIAEDLLHLGEVFDPDRLDSQRAKVRLMGTHGVVTFVGYTCQ